MKNKDYVLASEIADYIYCQCCFFDRLEGFKKTTVAMQQGTEEHDVVANQLLFLGKLQRFAILLMVSSVLLFIITVVLWYIFKPV